MQLRNNSELANWQMLSFTNRGKMVKAKDGVTGDIVERQEKPNYKLIHVPPLATVEIDDEMWANATYDTKRTRAVYKESKVKIEGVKNGKKDLYRTVREDTGETEEFCLIQEAIDKGYITIVEHPKSALTKEEMQAALKAKGVPTTADADAKVINDLYNKVCR